MALHLILGSMYSGKTTQLKKEVQSISSYTEVMLIKHSKDTRYSGDSVVTHNGDKVEALPLSALLPLCTTAGLEEWLLHKFTYKRCKVIAIDEAQFYDHAELVAFVKLAMRDGKTIYLAGLDGDSNQKAFLPLNDLVPLATTCVKLQAFCALCGDGTVASYSIMTKPKTEQVVVGGRDRGYLAVCYRHLTTQP